VYKRQYQNTYPDEIVKWAVHGAINGDTKFLHDKLDQLYTIESLASINLRQFYQMTDHVHV